MTEKMLKPHEKSLGRVVPYKDDERRRIEKYLRDGIKQKEIGVLLNRSATSIHAEVKRNGGKHGYNAEKAIEAAIERHKARGGSNYIDIKNDLDREALVEKIKAMAAQGLSKNAATKELRMSHSTLRKITERYHINFNSIGLHENAIKISSLEEKINNITFQIEIILDLVKQIKGNQK